MLARSARGRDARGVGLEDCRKDSVIVLELGATDDAPLAGEPFAGEGRRGDNLQLEAAGLVHVRAAGGAVLRPSPLTRGCQARPAWFENENGVLSMEHPHPQVHFCTFGWNESPTFRVVALALVGYHGESTVIGRQYFLRQAATALEFARSTNDPKLAAALIEKASNFLAQIDESGARPDSSPQAPDVQPEQ